MVQVYLSGKGKDYSRRYIACESLCVRSEESRGDGGGKGGNKIKVSSHEDWALVQRKTRGPVAGMIGKAQTAREFFEEGTFSTKDQRQQPGRRQRRA